MLPKDDGTARASVARPSTVFTRRLILSGLGAVYAVAFASLWVQIDGLIGSEGILPATDTLHQVRRALGDEAPWRLPTLCWWGSGDGVLHALCAAGVGLSLLLVAGVAPSPVLALIWLFYLSLTSVGGTFLSYQWDTLLLETAFLAIFLAPRQLLPRDAHSTPVPAVGLFLMRWLAFRLFFMSGAAKLLFGDPTWRGLTALDFHYFTQPIPTWTSFFAHHLPTSLQRVSVFGTLLIETVVPFLVFGPRAARMLACAAFALLQILILATGNYGFFNVLTLVVCLSLLDDRATLALAPRRWRDRWASRSVPVYRGTFGPARIVSAAVAVFVVGLSGAQMLERLTGVAMPGALDPVRRTAGPLRTLNNYGLFATMTTERSEIIVEGSLDGTEWRTYAFRYKPGDVRSAPHFAGLHMPRLDWQMWFAALRGCALARWFQLFSLRLLEGAPDVMALLAENPFEGEPPRYIRSTLYRYTFASPEQRRETGEWWVRERLGPFCPVQSLPVEARGRLRVLEKGGSSGESVLRQASPERGDEMHD